MALGALSFTDEVANVGSTANLDNIVNEVAPMATTYHAAPSVALPAYVPPNASTGKTGLATFGSFLDGLAHGVGHTVSLATGWLAHTVETSVTSVLKTVPNDVEILANSLSSKQQNAQTEQLLGRQQNLSAQWRAGKISTVQFQAGLKDIVNEQNLLAKQINDTAKNIQLEGGIIQKNSLDAVATVITLATMGVGGAGVTAGEKLASAFLIGRAADASLLEGASAVAKIVATPELVDTLSTGARAAIERSIAETVASAPVRMTAGQLARSATVNLALKYPIYFSWTSSTAKQIYNELDNQKYGDAVRTIAFNAALLLSGGPIGKALEATGKAVGSVVGHTFGESSFWDELSKFYGAGGEKVEGTENGFSVAAQKMSEGMNAEDKATFYKNLSAVESTNVYATGGDAQAAAMRVAAGEQSTRGLTGLSEMTHEQGLQSMVNVAKWQRVFSELGNAKGEEWTAGRIDTFDKNALAKNLSIDDDAVAQRAWKGLVADNANEAWANSDSFDKQMTRILSSGLSGDEKATAINKIKTALKAEGVPDNVLKEAADDGYIPIIRPKMEAPFREGTGKITSAFTPEDSQFWNKAVQPLPVLGSVGSLLTKMGLSPQASTQRVYQMFNENLAKSLQSTGAINRIIEDTPVQAATKGVVEDEWVRTGLSPEDIAYAKKFKLSPERAVQKFSEDEGAVVPKETPKATPKATSKATSRTSELVNQQKTDTIIKKLSSYAKKPTASKVPISDLRQLTTKDIQKALGANEDDAKLIQRAIARAMIQVPLAVRGLGDEAVDRAYPAIRRYLRVQGALRFSWNPFFQYLRLIPKTEYLTEASGGGVFRSVFAGRLGAISDIRTALHDGGFLDTTGKGKILTNVLSGEAVDSTGVGETANLSKKLLPMQERSIAGLVDAQAQRMGMDYKTYMATYPEQVRNTIQAIAQYDKHAGFLNSPLMRTLNIAFFPLRFETKVATITAKALAKTSLLTQVSVIKGMLAAHQWLNSPEGVAWYSQNADAIQLFEYISPIAEMSDVADSLLPGHSHTLGNFGELGGLPFGWIPQLLDAEGLTHFNAPAVDSKTGAVDKTYVPASMRGQMVIAIQDLLGALFTYPGAEAGLPSKASVTRYAALAATGSTKAKDLKLNTPTNLSAQQMSYSEQVQALQGGNPAGNATPSPYQTPTIVPSTPSPLEVPKLNPSTAKKKTKAEETPEVLPNEATLNH